MIGRVSSPRTSHMQISFEEREESGSLIKGAWLKRLVIRGARNLNLKRSVQLRFETVGRYRLWAGMWLNQIWEAQHVAEFSFKLVFFPTLCPVFHRQFGEEIHTTRLV